MESSAKKYFCKVCRKDFHNIYNCPYIIIEPKDNFMSFMNNCKYNLINKNNWPFPFEICLYIQEILTKMFLEEVLFSIKNSYSHYQYSDEITYQYISDVRGIIKQNTEIEPKSKSLPKSHFYYQFSLGHGLRLIVLVRKLYLPLLAYKYHVSSKSCKKILHNLTKNSICVN
jgi:hypothetical protein